MNQPTPQPINAVNIPRYPKRAHEMNRYTDAKGRRWFMRAEYGPKTCYVKLTNGSEVVKVFGRLPFENGAHWQVVKKWIDNSSI